MLTDDDRRQLDALAGATCLVTGGAGFIGSFLCEALAELGARVIALDSLRYGSLDNLAGCRDRVEALRFSIGDESCDRIAAEVRRADYLFHLAAEKHNQSKDQPEAVFRANLIGFHDLLHCALQLGVRRCVFSSSLYAYGRTSGGPMREDELPRPCTIYGITKLAGEHLLGYFARNFGLSAVALRYFFVYGPRQLASAGYKSVIVKSFERIARGQAPLICGDGEQALDYLFVEDVVRATLLAALCETTGPVLNVGSGEPTTVNALTRAMLTAAGSPLEPLHVAADWTAGSCRYGETSLVRRTLGWQPRVSLADGLRRTFAWVARERAPAGAMEP